MEPTVNNTEMKEQAIRRVFLPSDVLNVFTAGFLDETRCRNWVLEQIHPDGARCPQCSIPIEKETARQRFWHNMRIQCPGCGKFFTATTGTFIKGTHMSFQELVLLALMLALGQSNTTIARIVCEDPETVRLWRNRFAMIETAVKISQ